MPQCTVFFEPWVVFVVNGDGTHWSNPKNVRLVLGREVTHGFSMARNNAKRVRVTIALSARFACDELSDSVELSRMEPTKP